jgi:hypothetical protein
MTRKKKALIAELRKAGFDLEQKVEPDKETSVVRRVIKVIKKSSA